MEGLGCGGDTLLGTAGYTQRTKVTDLLEGGLLPKNLLLQLLNPLGQLGNLLLLFVLQGLLQLDLLLAQLGMMS